MGSRILSWWRKALGGPDPESEPERETAREKRLLRQIEDLRKRNGEIHKRNAELVKQQDMLRVAQRQAAEERKILLDARYDRREADVLLLCCRIAMTVLSGGTPTPGEYQDRVMLGEWLDGRKP